MLTISENTDIETVITTFEVTPGTCADLLKLLKTFIIIRRVRIAHQNLPYKLIVGG